MLLIGQPIQTEHLFLLGGSNMQRKFKFRIWDSMYWDWKNPEDYTYTELFLDDRYIVQQFTGLEDKNGVEIYEGDIIRGMMYFGPAGFHERSVIIKWDNEKGYQWNYWDLNSMKVEGNMFENPELLK
jgi:hypothetical protein